MDSLLYVSSTALHRYYQMEGREIELQEERFAQRQQKWQEEDYADALRQADAQIATRNGGF
jgi:hypothetical protein